MNEIFKTFDALSKRKPAFKLEIRFNQILRKKLLAVILFCFVLWDWVVGLLIKCLDIALLSKSFQSL